LHPGEGGKKKNGGASGSNEMLPEERGKAVERGGEVKVTET